MIFEQSNPDYVNAGSQFTYSLSDFLAIELKEMTGHNHMTLVAGGQEHEISGSIMFAPSILSPVVLLTANAIAYSLRKGMVIDLTGSISSDNLKPFYVRQNSELPESAVTCLPHEFKESLRGVLTLLLPIIEKGDGLQSLSNALKPVMEGTSTFDTAQFYDGLLGAIFKQREAIQVKANEALICPYGG